MQFLTISPSDTLQSLTQIAGSQNIDLILAENSLKREPQIGRQWQQKCENLLATQPNNISAARKQLLLNLVTDSQEVFEKCCLLDEDGWKIFSAFQAFEDAIKIPQTVQLPLSIKIIGAARNEITEITTGDGLYRLARRSNSSSNNVSQAIQYASNQLSSVNSVNKSTKNVSAQADPVSPNIYRQVNRDLATTGEIRAENLEAVNTSKASNMDQETSIKTKSTRYSFNLPWGKIYLFSTLMKKGVEIPAYPEQVDTSRSATYTAMPDIIYQYEPWVMYENSGPREQQISFHLHRDMWSGDHRDGRANDLIRFCEANLYPQVNGSLVNSSTVRLYVDGYLFINGVMTRVEVNWKGPIGLDNWYLEFDLNLSIQEVSTFPLTLDSVQDLGIIGV